MSHTCKLGDFSCLCDYREAKTSDNYKAKISMKLFTFILFHFWKILKEKETYIINGILLLFINLKIALC